ncbi:MAG: acetylxylan esterase [Gemmatimonadetes bacterium]|nr:acetylxylan esterase [Gemmatimonadota bacterium]
MYSHDPLPPVDRRGTEIRHLNLSCEFVAPATKEAWEKRARSLREHILVSMGLWPNPTRSLLNAEITHRVEREGYSIENVRFQSLPGFYVTGNLYRPAGDEGSGDEDPRPAILNPHGHWTEGRLNHEPDGSIPARCINFALQGYVAFAWSMAGYNDSTQLAHRTFGDDRKLLWGLSLMGLQLWNGMRSIDFLQSLPDVDNSRIACTGASGGGTQTFLLTAVDDRVKAAAPVNMVSAHMQGGCICENGPNLRIDTNNMEIAALAAPRPLLLVSATGDWTVNTPVLEYPAIRAVYALYDAEDCLTEVQIDAGHNYNAASREAVYAWFGKWMLEEESDDRFSDRTVEVEPPERMLAVTPETKPDVWIDEDGLTSGWIERARKQLDKMKPADAKSLRRFRQVMSAGFRSIIGSPDRSDDDLVVTPRGRHRAGVCAIHSGYMGRRDHGDRVPYTEFRPPGLPRGAVLVVHPGGASALTQDNGRDPRPLILHLLGKGRLVLVVDVFLTGLADGEPETGEPDTGEHAYFSTYNRTATANRVQDLLTAVAWLRRSSESTSVSLVGIGAAGPWCLLACGLCPQITRAVIDAGRFDTDSDEEYEEKLFIPVLRRLGGLAAAAALATPAELYLHNTGTAFQTDEIEAAYRAADALDRLRAQRAPADMRQVIAWTVEGSRG